MRMIRTPSSSTDSIPAASIFFGGLLSVLSQAVVLREYLFGEHQAELASGLVLAAWIAGSGMGAAVGGRLSGKVRVWIAGLLLLPALGLLDVYLSRIGSASLFLCVMPMGIVAGSVFIQPFAFAPPGKVYALESAGAAAGGAVFVIVSPLMLAGSMLLASACFSALGILFARRYATGIILALVIAFSFLLDLPGAFARFLSAMSFSGSRVVQVDASPYGEVALVERQGQYSVYRGGILEASWPSLESAERMTVVPLAAAGPESVLYIGASPEEAGIIADWPGVKEAVCVVPDAALIGAVSYPEGTTAGDGRHYLATSDRSFDLVEVSAGQPLTLLENRYYTEEFMKILSGALKPRGMAVVHLQGGANRLHPLEAQLARSVQLAANEHFSWTRFIPMSGLLLIMGNGPEPSLNGDSLACTLDSLGFSGVSVSSATLPYDLSRFRMDSFRDQVEETETGVNRDLHPLGFDLSREMWALRTGRESGWKLLPIIALVLIALMVAASVASGNVSRVMAVASTGFAGLSLEVISLVAIQASTGYSWVLVGAVTGIFMTGAAMGAFSTGRRSQTSLKIYMCCALLALALSILALILYDSGTMGGTLLSVILLSDLFLCGLSSGGAFTKVAAEFRHSSTGSIGILSLADCSASAAACLVIPLILFPAFGAVVSLLPAAAWLLIWTVIVH